ncbi:MAG: hypothetical protein V7K21_02500 [Nostoc sp.]|uniref:hypothetical protein n=1 Tax=Nostoc sp. TaxID=1180 RepID=UPI002FFA13A8
MGDLIDHLIAPIANHRPQNTQVILQKLNEIEKALQMPKILCQQTTIQSNNGSKSAASSSSVVTVSVGGIKSVNAPFSQTRKRQKLWQVFIGLGVGCFAVFIADLNLPNNKNLVSVSPEENVPVPIHRPVTKVYETPPNAQPQPTISSLNLPTSDKLGTEQAQIEEIEKEKLQAALKAEQEKQAAIKKEAAATAEREQLEAVIRENEHQDALVAQKRQQADKDRQTKIKLEKAKQVYLQIKQQPKTTVVTSITRKLTPKQEVPKKQLTNAIDIKDDTANIPNPWESTYPIPKTYDELKQVIREENQ